MSRSISTMRIPSIGSAIVGRVVFFVLTVALLLGTYRKYKATG